MLVMVVVDQELPAQMHLSQTEVVEAVELVVLVPVPVVMEVQVLLFLDFHQLILQRFLVESHLLQQQLELIQSLQSLQLQLEVIQLPSHNK